MSNVPREPIHGPMAWTANTVLDNDGVEYLDEPMLGELRAAAAELEANPLPIAALRSDDFDMPACRELCSRIKHALDHGAGFAIIDRLPIDELGRDNATALYWILLQTIGRPVAQKWNGELIFDVRDTGRKATAGSGVRPSKTNAQQVYHTDNSFNLPPEYVGLLCMQPAREGGVSGIISFDSVFNRLLSEQPDVLARLVQPFCFDRQHEHPPGEPGYSENPVFEFDGGVLQVRLATNLIRQGYVVAERKVDDETLRALDMLDAVMSADDLGKTFDFERGQIQILNNRRIGHQRTAFVDWPEPERKRHLVRVWLRNHGRGFYMG